MNNARITTRAEVDEIMEAYLALPNLTKYAKLARAYGAKDADIEGEVVAIVESTIGGLNRKDVLRAQIAQMQQELTELEQFPPDNFEVGTIIAFDKRYDGREQVFCYSAIKGTETLWYLSGLVSTLLSASNVSRYRVTYEVLTNIMRDAVNVRVIFKEDGHPLRSSPAQQASLAKVDDFLADPSTGVKLERPLRDGGFLSTTTKPTYGHVDVDELIAERPAGFPLKNAPEPDVRTPVRDPNR